MLKNLQLKSLALVLFSTGLFCSGQSREEFLKIKLDSAFSTVFQPNSPGGSILIQQGNKTLYENSFGLADLKTKEKFTNKTVSNLGSISKTFVSYGILILQNRKKLSADDNLLTFFPDFKNKKIASDIKLRHLLTHTSGLPDLRHVEKDSIFYLTAKDEENFKPLQLTDSLHFEPGTQYEYSNPAYNGLALIIEKASHMKWQRFISENIFKPSGMKNSTITDGSFPDKNVAHGYILKDKMYQEYDYGEYPTFTAAGNGGVWSSIDDLKKYISAIQTCKLTDCVSIKESQTVRKPVNWKSDKPADHTGTWFVHPGFYSGIETEENVQVIEHAGDQGGFKSHLIMIPKKEISIIWLTNNNAFITGHIRRILLQLKYID
ncbi:beta-lactamase family protein [Chryseobacterium sp. Tr-659]|uniref:serine hydrolase domain-containing protein n=1 Tax=Chryseobacterium sp. Tr-659 TaxID=2608340 RepID=UPI0014233CE7|nr:serine hydrolase domain-containing protein [Chryseobacterium sp. Tr-659]NIF07559.1 beta-lactamase family protein [Chryseobacterium sp. Tr-659]